MVTGTGMTVAPPDPETVIEEELIVALSEAVVLASVRLPKTDVNGAVPITVGGWVSEAAPDSVAFSDPAGEVVGKVAGASVASEEAAPDSTLENPEARDSEAAGFVSTTLESSELSEEAKLDSAPVALAEIVEGSSVAWVPLPLDSAERIEEPAEATRLEASPAADGTRPPKKSLVVVAEAEGGVVAVL